MLRRIPLLMVASFLGLAACSKGVPEPGESTFKPAPPAPPDPGPATLGIVDEVVGTGKEAKPGDTVRVHYTGTLLSGVEFDSSRGKSPFDFKLGAGSVIKGWDQGVVGMRVGGHRQLVIPQALAYGEAGNPPKIPPKAGLKFDVELLEVNPAKPAAPAPPPDPGMDMDPGVEPDPDEQP
jgi:hypothetical protein